jgi:hypothetical protein
VKARHYASRPFDLDELKQKMMAALSIVMFSRNFELAAALLP